MAPCRNIRVIAIQNQFGNLDQLTSIGQNAAAGAGNAGSNAANQNSALLQSMGNAQASGALAQGQANVGLANSAMGALGAFGQLGGFGNLNQTPQTAYTGASGLSSGGYYVPSSF